MEKKEYNVEKKEYVENKNKNGIRESENSNQMNKKITKEIQQTS